MMRVGLALLSIILALGPLAYGLYLYQNNVQAYVTPSLQNLEEVFIPQMPQLSFVAYEVVDVDIQEGVFQAVITLSIHNPLPYTLTLEDVSFNLVCASLGHGNLLGEGHLRQPVSVEPGDTAEAYIDLSISQEGMAHIQAYHLTITPTGPNTALVTVSCTARMEDAVIRIRAANISMELEGEMGEVPIYYEEEVSL
ncbi:MAG: hypothetical protein DRN06_00240 [Thermoprotei archaeon]|nr:MAG: hypothetical protein DRN06_00240 [Thermoprotei archaeon]